MEPKTGAPKLFWQWGDVPKRKRSLNCVLKKQWDLARVHRVARIKGNSMSKGTAV